MISVFSSFKHDAIKELLEQEAGFKFVKKAGLKQFFEFSTDSEAAIITAKSLIKSTDWGKALYFSVISEN